MKGLLELPRELLHRVYLYADAESRKALRLTCPLLGDIGKQWVFRHITFNTENESCTKAARVFDNPELAQYVTKVYLDLIDWEWDRPEEESEDEAYEDMGEEIAALPRRFRKLLDRLHELPKLQGVVLSFHPECIGSDNDWQDAPQDMEFRSAMMERFISRVAQFPRLPSELAIHNLQNINVTNAAAVANLNKVLESLRTLRLNITHEHSEGNGENDIENDEPHTFLSELPSFWLKPTTSKLQHLTLYSSMYFGFYPALDLSTIRFPHLKSLALGNYTFIHDSQLDWILAHASSLTELYLDDCPILFEAAVYKPERTLLPVSSFSTHKNLPDEKKYVSYAKRWKDYFRAFQEGLPLLRQFRYGHSKEWWVSDSTPFEAETGIKPRMGRESYMVYCDGFGPSQYMRQMVWTIRNGDEWKWEDGESLDPTDEDLTALLELCKKIGQVVQEGVDDDDDDDFY